MKKSPPRSIRRILTALAAAVVVSLPVHAQNQTKDDGATDAGPIVNMSAFEVTTTQGHGYVSTNAASAFKTNESLMNIPQGDIVVTNDLINDIGYTNTTDVLAFFGASAGFEGEATQIRGGGAGYPYIDSMQVQSPYLDNAIVDSYEVIKGPAEAVYQNAPLSGIVLKSTKKPLPYRQDILTASIDGAGLYRFVGDFTGPLGRVGDAQLSYRFVGVYQSGKTYFQNVKNGAKVLFPKFQVVYHNTTVRLSYNYQSILRVGGNENLLTPSGGLYTGAGRDVSNQPPNNSVTDSYANTELEVLQKVSDTWENRLSAIYSRFLTYGSVIYVDDYDWTKGTEDYSPLIYNALYHYWTVLDDTTGKYTIGPSNWQMNNVDAFGFGFSSFTIKSQYWNTAPFPYPNGPTDGTGIVTVPFNNATAINSIIVPPASAYTPPANEGSLSETWISSIYASHSTDVIPNWLTLSAAFSWDNASSTGISNISTLPFNGKVVTAFQWLHRLGAVLHLTQHVSLYALDSTTFTPPGSGGILQNGQLPPNKQGKGSELGLKTSFLGGRLSGEFAWFQMATTNVTRIGGNLPNGFPYQIAVGTSQQEGVDGDAAFQILPGWQLIGAFYAGHNRASELPVPNTYDNSWSAYSRYAIPRGSPLHGLAFGGGLTRVGGRWASTQGLLGVTVPAGGVLKMKTGSLLNAFVEYSWTKHWLFRIGCNNILDESYPVGAQTAYYVDPSTPRLFNFLVSYKF